MAAQISEGENLAIDPRNVTQRVPAAWRALRVAKQSDEDHACGLFAFVTAARMLGCVGDDEDVHKLLGRLDPADSARIRFRLPTVGLYEKDIRALAKSVGLSVYRPNLREMAQFHEPGWIWMAFVLVRFTSPDGIVTSASHYVLILDYLATEAALVVADPHPWNRDVYCVPEEQFEAAWLGAKDPPWAAAVHKY